MLCGLAVLAASLIALPAGFYIGHTGRFQLLGLNLANIGRAIPSYAVMVMVFPVALAAAEPLGYDPRLGLTFLPIFVAMTLLAIPPILVATFAGIAEVDRDVVESSRGMGLTERQVLAARRAAPGAAGHHRWLPRRDAAGHRDRDARGGPLGGGFGRFIIDGLARRDEGMLYAGVVLVACLAVGTDLLLAGLQRRFTPRGVKVASGEAVLEAIGDLGSVAPPSLRRA